MSTTADAEDVGGEKLSASELRAARRMARRVESYRGDTIVDSDDAFFGAYFTPVVLQDLTDIERLLRERKPLYGGFDECDEPGNDVTPGN